MLMDSSLLLEKFLLQKDPYEILNLLEVIQKLLRRYWKKIIKKSFLKGLEDVNKDVADLTELLLAVNLLEEKNLSRFVRDFKKRISEQRLDFIVSSNDEKIIPSVRWYLNRTFWKVNLSFEKIESDNLVVNAKGHWYSFKRSLESDIDKLLA